MSQDHKITCLSGRQAKSQVDLRKAIILSILSGALLSLPFINGRLWVFAWVGFLPLFFALENRSNGKAFLLAYLAGIIFWSFTIYWLIHVTLAGTILLILYLALYFGFLGLFFSAFCLLPTTYYLFFLPSVWVILEYIRSHLLTGFPWALLGYSQYLNLPVIQIADIAGAWSVSFLVVMVNIFIYKVVGRRLWVMGEKQKSLPSTIYYLLPIVILLLALGYGFFRLRLPPVTCHLPTIKVSVIQGNIPQELKWHPETEELIISKYFALTKRAAVDNPDLIIWPEASLPVVLEEKPIYFVRTEDLVRNIGIPLLLGAPTLREGKYFNSALLLSWAGQVSGRYDKLHLVPFGEYIPLRKALPFLQAVVPIGDFSAGKEYTIFKINEKLKTKNEKRFSVLICFEDLFPELSRRFTKSGAQFLANITNDAWYKHTPAPYQHLAASVFRAVENRVFLVRSANTGVSAFIDAQGKVESRVHDAKGKDIFVDGCKTQEIWARHGSESFYTRYGDFFPGACFLFILYAIIWAAIVKR